MNQTSNYVLNFKELVQFVFQPISTRLTLEITISIAMRNSMTVEWP
jgi:hypothetical protein